jgi:hypothetical protein
MRIPLLSRTFPVTQNKIWISRTSRTSLRDPSTWWTVKGMEGVHLNLCSNCCRKYSTRRSPVEDDNSPEVFLEYLRNSSDASSPKPFDNVEAIEPTELSTRREELKKKDRRPGHPYFVTTPIFYVNGGNRLAYETNPIAPHIGHMHSMVIADVAKRYRNLKHAGRVKSLLSTGTDEHGMKVEPLMLWLTNRYNKQLGHEIKIL